MIRSMKVAGIIGAMAVGIAGCGSDDDSPGIDSSGTGAVPVVTGLPASKPLNTLTASERTQYCKAVDAAVKSPEVSDGVCKFMGVLGAALEASLVPATTEATIRMTCSSTYDECRNDKEPVDCDPVPASCNATVAEAERCKSDQLAVLVKMATRVPACASLTKPTLSSAPSLDDLADPASCTALADRCPQLLE